MGPKGGGKSSKRGPSCDPSSRKSKPPICKTERRTKGSSSSSVIDDCKLSPDFFRPLVGYNVLMGILLGILAMCAVDPEDCVLIPVIGDTLADQSPVLAGVFGFLMFVNLVMTLQVMKLCKKNGLDGRATNRWLGQTLISGVFSWKVLKDADLAAEMARPLTPSMEGSSVSPKKHRKK